MHLFLAVIHGRKRTAKDSCISPIIAMKWASGFLIKTLTNILI